MEAIKNCGLVSQTKFYQASTSELYGDTLIVPQNEQTPFNPCSPYAIAKHYAFQMTKLYREAYGMYACNGILFNHESPVRGETFVTRKITIALSKIFKGIQECLFLGNLDSKRDWGHAEDYVRAQWLILQAQEPDDYVVSTGEQISVRDFVELCLKELGISIKWQGNGIDECGIVTDVAQSEYGNTDLTKGSVIVRVSKDYFRPAEVSNLLGDSTKIRTNLNWRPSISVDQLAKEMIISDLQKI